MELNCIAPTTAQRLPFVAPTYGRVRAELRPQGVHTSRVNDIVPAAGDAGTSLGTQPWSPPIT